MGDARDDVVWYAWASGQRYGPYSQNMIEQYRASGQLGADALYCRDGEAFWKPAEKVFPPPIPHMPPVPIGPPVVDRYNGSGPSVELVCPRCNGREPQHAEPIFRAAHYQCHWCGAVFLSGAVKVRAKQQRTDRYTGIRSYTIRVIEADGSESVLRFSASSGADLEVRSGDAVVFTIYEARVRIVQNMTTREWFDLGSSQTEGLAILGAVLRHWRL